MKVSRRRVLILSSLGLVGVSIATLPQLIERLAVRDSDRNRSRTSTPSSTSSPSTEDSIATAKSNSQFSQPLDLKNESTQVRSSCSYLWRSCK